MNDYVIKARICVKLYYLMILKVLLCLKMEGEVPNNTKILYTHTHAL